MPSELEKAVYRQQERDEVERRAREVASAELQRQLDLQKRALENLDKLFKTTVAAFIREEAKQMIPKELAELCEETAEVFFKKTGVRLEKKTTIYCGDTDLDSNPSTNTKQKLLESYNAGKITHASITIEISYRKDLLVSNPGDSSYYLLWLGVQNRPLFIGYQRGIHTSVGPVINYYDGSPASLEKTADSFAFALKDPEFSFRLNYGTDGGADHEGGDAGFGPR